VAENDVKPLTISLELSAEESGPRTNLGHSIGPDHQPTIPPDPVPCETKSAILGIESTSYATTISGGQTSVKTQTMSKEFTILGCNVQDDEIKTTTASCNRPTARAEPGNQGRGYARDLLSERAPPDACDPTTFDVILYMGEPKNAKALRDQLTADGKANKPSHGGFTEIRSEKLDFTAFFYLKGASTDYANGLLKSGRYGVWLRPQPSTSKTGLLPIEN